VNHALAWGRDIQAVMFDMDGTLVDSEHLTDLAVERTLAQYGIDIEVDTTIFHGVTWRRIASILRSMAPALDDVPLEAELQTLFHDGLLTTDPAPIPGARATVMAAAARVPAAITSSSDRASVDHVVARLDLAAHLQTIVCAQDIERSKPDPQIYELAAVRLGIPAKHGLVFEDAIAGLQAARAAGMRTIAIARDRTGSEREALQALADVTIADFTELPAGFLASLGGS